MQRQVVAWFFLWQPWLQCVCALNHFIWLWSTAKDRTSQSPGHFFKSYDLSFSFLLWWHSVVNVVDRRNRAIPDFSSQWMYCWTLSYFENIVCLFSALIHCRWFQSDLSVIFCLLMFQLWNLPYFFLPTNEAHEIFFNTNNVYTLFQFMWK